MPTTGIKTMEDWILTKSINTLLANFAYKVNHALGHHDNILHVGASMVKWTRELLCFAKIPKFLIKGY